MERGAVSVVRLRLVSHGCPLIADFNMHLVDDFLYGVFVNNAAEAPVQLVGGVMRPR